MREQLLPNALRLNEYVIRGGICTSCGACAALSQSVTMVDSPEGPRPDFTCLEADLPDLAWDACPGKGIDYFGLYEHHYGGPPANWLTGYVQVARIAYAADSDVRRRGASGGVTTAVLIHLLETGRIDGAFVVKQGLPEPEKARVVLARTREEILEASQSIYIPVSVLDALKLAVPGETYAMVCLPDQAAALRTMQKAGDTSARQVRFVLGPYTGTALYPQAIDALLRTNRVPRDDRITRLRWRAGEWPGEMRIHLASGRVVTTKKVYYNFLIPFFVTQASLQSIDFVNEFADLSVGDAWSPKYESRGEGFSLAVTRSQEMESVISEMVEAQQIVAEEVPAAEAVDMHGHMLDFKKRGAYIRNRWRRQRGHRAPDYGMRPVGISRNRYAVEAVISAVFLLGRLPAIRTVMTLIPESVLGPIFNRLRLIWKAMSKPSKRKGLAELQMEHRRYLG